MTASHLNEHDANQGAQSKGEFLGMSGNSGWYLLGAAGTTILMVILLWGVFGVSLLLCLLAGVVLCLLSIIYVFALKNNRPEHYDTDFFESALIDAGVLELAFGPRERRPVNPFSANVAVEVETPRLAAGRGSGARCGLGGRSSPSSAPAQRDGTPAVTKPKKPTEPEVPTVTLAAYENLREELVATEDMLEDALVERGEI
jgi:hypothetical protein